MDKHEPGIYEEKDKKDLYLISELAQHMHNTPLCFVVCYSLFPTENPVRVYPHEEFKKALKGKDTYGMALTKIRDWKEPSIIPGAQFRESVNRSHSLFTIRQVVLKETNKTKEVVVEADAPNFGQVSIPIDDFLLQRYLLV